MDQRPISRRQRAGAASSPTGRERQRWATLVRSTQQGTSFNAGVGWYGRSDRALPAQADRTIFNLIETYGKLTQPVIPQTVPPSPPSVAVTSIFHSDAERDEYFNQRVYALIAMAFDTTMPRD